MVAKHRLLLSEFFFPSILTAAQINDLGEIGGKPREEGERTLISNLYLRWGHEGQWALHNKHPHLNMETIRYPQFLNTCVARFQKERNETYEMYQMMSRKQKDRESLESFYAELGGMAVRCNLGTQERKIVRDIFIFNMRNRDAQNELCRETKTPEEALRIAMSYKRGDKYAKTYKGVASGSTGTGNGLFIARWFSADQNRTNQQYSWIQGTRNAKEPGPIPKSWGGGGEVAHKSECKNGYVTIAISRISLQNTDNDTQQEPSHATFAKRWAL